MSRPKLMLFKIGLLLASITLTLIVAEALTYLSLDRINLQKGKTIVDPRLIRVIEPHSAGHDAWGLRNDHVPDSASIVAIGDSQTYGVAAQSDYSWPSQLAQELDTDVYNMGLGSWGPHQYLALLEEEALSLDPEIAVVGLYFGNDLANASNYHRVIDRIRRDPDYVPWNTSTGQSVGDMLSEYSNIYRLMATVIVPHAQLTLSRYGLHEYDAKFTELVDEPAGIRTFLTPSRRLRALDRDDPSIERGFEETIGVLGRMSQICRENEIDLLVLLISTKETVYRAPIEEHIATLSNAATLHKLMADEAYYIERSLAFLEAAEIDYIDLRSPLSAQLSVRSPYPNHDDGHPNRYGYEIIARETAEFIRGAGWSRRLNPLDRH